MMVNGSQTPGLAQVFTTFTTRVPQLFVDVDRVKAKSMNVGAQRRERHVANLSRLALRE
jgi:multidrug efflux pump subunit AcrB